MFSSRPPAVERLAINYLVQMRWEPMADAETFVAHMRTESPSVTVSALANIWAKFKHFFNGQDQQSYQKLEHLMNIDEMVKAFEAAPYINLKGEDSVKQEPKQSTNAQPITTLTDLPPSASASSTTTRARPIMRKVPYSNSNFSSSSSASASLLSVGAINRMRFEFQRHNNTFTCAPWITPSGVDVDTTIAGHVLTLTAESSLHSFTVTDSETVLKLFTSTEDKQAVSEVLKGLTDDDTIWTLSKAEEHYLSLYDKPPGELEDVLDMGCLGVMADAKVNSANSGAPCDLPDRSFCSLVHGLFGDLFRVYKRNKFQLPTKKSESWFRENLWATLHNVFNVPDELCYEPGEVHSQASARRKNRERESTQTKLHVGRKADGLASSATPACELLVVEAANIDNGFQGTKAMNDTLKLTKTMKDMFDYILEKIEEKTKDEAKLKIARDQLITFGLRISAGSFALYTLRKLAQGRYYVFTCEGILAFPEVWKDDGSNTSTILMVIYTLLAMKRQLLEMAKKIMDSTKVGFKLPKPVGVEDRDWPATLTTPTNTPRQSPSTPSTPAPLSPLYI
ncbi:hypothetical protein BGZ99_001401 [Dissophora globulifera]|uniref:Uncharacterized protein n=1 Tax=Dissophora globulifera TaxID=979702 RepID=A0A9P6RTK7_9FUNG|nr:hypothetical protein BGZ99_001401 [Dissophora globulifera]